MTLILFILICYGVTNILVFGTIFARPRAWLSRNATVKDFITCPMCIGFWVGLVVSLAGYGVTHWFIDACIASGTSYLLYALATWFEWSNS